MKKFTILLMLISIFSFESVAQVQTTRRTSHKPSYRPSASGPQPAHLNYQPRSERETAEVKKFQQETARTGQSVWGIVKDHQKKYPWYTREMFLEDNPEIAGRKPYTKLNPCDSTKVLYTTVPIHPEDTYRLRLDEGGPVNPPIGG